MCSPFSVNGVLNSPWLEYKNIFTMNMLEMNIQISSDGIEKNNFLWTGIEKFAVLHDELNELPVNWEWGMLFVIFLVLTNSPTMPTLHPHTRMMHNIASSHHLTEWHREQLPESWLSEYDISNVTVIFLIFTMSVTNTTLQVRYYSVQTNEKWSCDIKQPYPLTGLACIRVTWWP